MRLEETIKSALASAKSQKVRRAVLLTPLAISILAYGLWEWSFRRVDPNQAVVIQSLIQSVSQSFDIDHDTVIMQIKSDFEIHSMRALSQSQYRCVVDRLSRWLVTGNRQGGT